LTSEDQQDQAWLATARAFLAAAEDRTDEVLRQGRTALENIHTLNPSTDCVRWTWGLAARAAHDLRDVATECELLSMLDGYRPGQLGPILNADRDVCLARLAPATEADALFIAAIAGLRERGTPYHLAHGLLDYAAFLTAAGRRDDAAPLVDEARRIGEELGAALVLRRVESAAPAAVSSTA
jgi:hypothetical protein